ncbi:MAG: hypothetical protein LC114_25820 [Bryobacterales bacterium]|nr:hypothetical protein [Bryobacterales bacterium]
MNTKHITDPTERKRLKRTARRNAPPKAKRPDNVDRGSMKRTVRKRAKGQTKR